MPPLPASLNSHQIPLLAQRHLPPQHTANRGDVLRSRTEVSHHSMDLVEVVLCQAKTFGNLHHEVTVLGATDLEFVRVTGEMRSGFNAGVECFS